jgi:hypothetical protein
MWSVMRAGRVSSPRATVVASAATDMKKSVDRFRQAMSVSRGMSRASGEQVTVGQARGYPG